MKKATITQLKNDLSAFLEMIKKGATILILDRNIPVATLSPTHALPQDGDGRVMRLERAGQLRRGEGKAIVAFLKLPVPRPRQRVSLLEALLEERSEGR